MRPSANVSDLIEDLLVRPAFGLRQPDKEATLGPVLDELTLYHAAHCPDYGRMLAATSPEWQPGAGIPALPYLPVSIFKRRTLSSVGDDDVFKTLTSSGTSGSAVSKIILDRATAMRQTRALAAVMEPVLGRDRRPMLIVDSPSVVNNRKLFSARGAGILGLMNFGRKHSYLLDEDFHPSAAALRAFVDRHCGEELFIFGFTFMVWKHLLRDLGYTGVDLSAATLVHSGGWKKLEEERVDNAELKRQLADAFGITRVYSFYGMVEQVGGVFVEGDDGWLHTPSFGDIIIRDPVTWEVQADGVEGLIQLVSVLPTSYPGHSILTEDIGVVEVVDSPTSPHLGKSFRVIGRVPQTQLRGCSDTYAYPTQAS
jgi:hypothetical protein